MSEIDPLVAEILLKGDDEFISKIKKVGEESAEKFSKLSESVQKGATSAEALTGSIGLIEGALAAATAATVVFIEQQTELSQKTELLANAFGVTTGQLQDIEATFASAGVKVEQFERFANRLTITIAREWPQIADSIKNYANENDAAQLRVTNSILRIQDAQKALGDNSAERASQIARDNASLEQSYIKLQFAASHAASEQLAALQDVRGAQLSVVAAEQHLAELEGRPPSAAEKQNLALAQAQQAVDTARRAEADARIAQQEKAASAALKQRQIEQEYDDLARKAAKNARDDAEQRQKDENALKEAIIARGEAEQKAAKLALTNVASIRDTLDSVVAGNKGVQTQIDLTEVSVQHLTQAIIAQAKESSKSPSGPSGYETLIALSKTLSAATEEQISKQQRLAIVNRLAGTSMTALGASASEILHVLEHDTDALEHLNKQTQALDTHEAKQAIEEFRGALARLNLDISILSQRFAIAASPVFTAFLTTIKDSIESNNGVIHTFIAGLQAIGSALSYVGEKINQFITYVAKMFDLTPAAAWKGIIVAIGVVVAATATALLAWPLIIATIITAVGYIADNWDKVKKGAEAAWQSVKDSTLYKFLDGVIERIKEAYRYFAALFGSPKTLPNNPANSKSSNASEGGDIQGHAEGGPIRGPGTGTSDSILARLSNGEFVTKAKAVAFWGADFMHAINNMQMPGFAQGGLVASPVRLGGGSIAPATSVLNLSIDGRSFNGLRGPKSTIDDLSSFAIARQASAAGNNPGWMK